MKTSEIVQTPLEMTLAVVAATRMASSGDSLPEYTAPTRLSPIVLIDNAVSQMDQGIVHSLLQTLLSVYSAHYLHAINLEANIGDVKVIRLLEKFSTDRDVLSAASHGMWLGLESINDTMANLPTYDLEALTDIDLRPSIAEAMTEGPRGRKDNKENILNIQDLSNLAVGKVLDVKLQSGEAEVTIPVTVTLKPSGISSRDIINVAKHHSIDKSMSGRLHQLRAGQIRFVKDYLLNLDLVEADRKALLAGKGTNILDIRSKRTKGILAALVSGTASPNAVSSMLIVSKSTAKELEMALKGRLKSSRIRNNFFKSNVLMMLVVVDTVMEKFTMYQRGIDEAADYTLDDIKANNKRTNGTDIEAVMKAYTMGSSAPL